MKSLLLDETGDIVIENGTFVMAEGDDELAQQVRIAWQTAKGEWFLDPDEGTNREPLIAKQFNENNARDSLIESLTGLTEPIDVETLSFSREGRTLFVDAILRKQGGTTLTMEGVQL